MRIPYPANSVRRLDWRYRRSLRLLERNKRPSLSKDDHWIWVTWRYFRGLARCVDERGRRRLRRRQGDIAAAVALRNSSDPLARWIVEALLLAGASSDEVADRTNLQAGDIEAYFYCILSDRCSKRRGGKRLRAFQW